MKRFKINLVLVLTLLSVFVECKRGGGGSRPSSHSRPSGSHSSPSHSSPSHYSPPSHPSPSHYSPPSHPSPSHYSPPSHPSPSHYSPPSYPSPSHNSGFGGSHPSPSHNTGYGGSHPSPGFPQPPPANRPGIGFENMHHQTNTHPLGSGASAPKPGIGFENINHQTNTHTLGSGVHTAPVGPPVQKPGIGFDNVNHAGGTPNKPHDIGFENVHNRLPSHPSHPSQPGHPNINHHAPAPVHQPYQPQTHVTNNNHVYYQPPVRPQYTPPPPAVMTGTNVYHHIPVYQPPTVIHSGSSGFGNTASFVGGYLIGRMGSSNHHTYHNHYSSNNNNYNNYNNNNNNNNYNGNAYYKDDTQGPAPIIYTVHHYYQNRQEVAPKFIVDGDKVIQCTSKLTETMCTPNTNPLCLNNGTMMCTTPLNFTVACNHSINAACVYTKIDSAGPQSLDVSQNQTSPGYFIPCISNMTLHYNVDYSQGILRDTPRDYELCITAIAEKQVLSSPVASAAKLIIQATSYFTSNLIDMNKSLKANATTVIH